MVEAELLSDEEIDESAVFRLSVWLPMLFLPCYVSWSRGFIYFSAFKIPSLA